MVTAVRKMLACFNDRLDSYNGLVWYDYSQLRNLFKIPSQPFLFVLLRICLQIFSRHCVIIYKKFIIIIITALCSYSPLGVLGDGPVLISTLNLVKS